MLFLGVVVLLWKKYTLTKIILAVVLVFILVPFYHYLLFQYEPSPMLDTSFAATVERWWNSFMRELLLLALVLLVDGAMQVAARLRRPDPHAPKTLR